MLLCVGFAVALPGFLTTNNLLNLVRSVSILGILGVAMGLVVIGRGIDLSLVALMAVSVAWTLQLAAGRHAAAAGRGHRPGLQPVDRRDHRLPHRLCRDPGDLRDARHGHADLRLRPLLPLRPRRHLHARRRPPLPVARPGHAVRRSGSDLPLRRRLSRRLSLPSLHEVRTLSARRRRQPRWPRASQAFRRGRSSSCNTCCRR